MRKTLISLELLLGSFVREYILFKIKISRVSIPFSLQKIEISTTKKALAKFPENFKFLWPNMCISTLITVMPIPFGAHQQFLPIHFQRRCITPGRKSYVSTKHSDLQDNQRQKGCISQENLLPQSHVRCSPSAGILKGMGWLRWGDQVHTE